MLDNLLFALWFFLPAGISNASAVVAAKLPLLKHWETPVDLCAKWRGKRLLGNHKTWRGLVVGTMLGIAVVYLQTIAYDASQFIREFCGALDYGQVSWWGLGAALGFGALLGDAVKSFLKRRVGVPSGKSWFPFDQLDYIAGALVLSAPLVALSAEQVVWIIATWFGMHLLFSYLGYLLHFKEDPL